MTVISDELLAELDRLTQEQIEEGLAAGVWGESTRPLVQHYLDQMKLDLAEKQVAEQRDIAQIAKDVSLAAMDKAVVAEEESRAANLKATAALIIAGGAMLAAMASALVAFLALRH
jgi:hypothetical protein